MPKFNPEQEPVIRTGLSGYSQGQTADRSLGELFQGLGETLQNVTSSINTQRKTEISLGATRNADDIAQSLLSEDTSAPIPPSEITQSGAEIRRYRTAAETGKFSMSFVYDKTLSRVKDLKARYPGYADIIDAEFSSALGQNIGIKLSLQLAEEAKARGEDIDAEVKFRRQFAKDKADYIGLAVEQNLLPEGNYLSGDYDINAVGRVVRKLEAKELGLKIRDSERNETKESASIMAQESVDHIMASAFNLGSKRMKDYLQGLNKAGSPESPGGVELTPEERKGITDSLAMLETETMLSLQPKLMAIRGLPSEERARIEEQAKRQFTILREQLFNENTGVMKALERYNKDVVQGQVSKLQRVSPLVVGQSLKEMGLPDVLVNEIIMEGLLKNTQNGTVYDYITTPGASVSDQDATMKSEGKTPEQRINQHRFTIEQNSKILSDKNIPIENLDTLIYNTFESPDAKVLLEKMAAKDPLPIFQMLVNPKIIERLKGTRHLQTLFSFADGQFDTVLGPMIAKEQGLSRTWAGLNLKWDEGQQKFIQDSETIQSMGGLDTTYRVGKINSYLQTIKPLIEEMGLDFEGYLETKFGLSRFNETEPEGSLFQKLFEGLRLRSTGPTDGSGSPKARGKQGSLGLSDRSLVSYANQTKTRNLKLTNTLEGKISEAVAAVYGEGYEAKVFSGGQPEKGSGKPRVGSIRHDLGKAADIYIYDKEGKKLGRKQLDKLREYWLENEMGSVGTYMRGDGMHLDEWTSDKLLPGMATAWRY